MKKIVVQEREGSVYELTRLGYRSMPLMSMGNLVVAIQDLVMRDEPFDLEFRTLPK